MYGNYRQFLQKELDSIQESGLYKRRDDSFLNSDGLLRVIPPKAFDVAGYPTIWIVGHFFLCSPLFLNALLDSLGCEKKF